MRISVLVVGFRRGDLPVASQRRQRGQDSILDGSHVFVLHAIQSFEDGGVEFALHTPVGWCTGILEGARRVDGLRWHVEICESDWPYIVVCF